MIKQGMSAKEFDDYFDNGGDVTDYIDKEKTAFPNRGDAPRRVNLNLPGWLVEAIDKEAKHLAIPRQSVVIVWLAERARQERLVN